MSRWYPSLRDAGRTKTLTPTSESCSNGGHQQNFTLADRIHKCENCGHVEDRDENAAVHMKNEG
ncbi:transposase [Nodularia sp. LEGE 04288]|uniref:transposase n=1 Tax=Nodularia sp. LEGE 06071 TaxID=2777965 RepID=UPI001D12B5E2